MDSGNIGDLDHTGHTDQATTQVVSEKSSEPKNDIRRTLENSYPTKSGRAMALSSSPTVWQRPETETETRV